MKPVTFCGDSLEELRRLPDVARREAGHQLETVQRGMEPSDWKPMPAVGAGVSEIRIRGERGIYRVLYVTKFREAIYVLHCFQMKTQKTGAADLEKASLRYKKL